MFSSRMIPSRRRIALTSSLLAVAAAMALSSCSPSSGAVRAEDSVTTITAAPLPPSSIDTTTSVTTTTVEPTTTAAPTTTESTTTTSTVPPTTVPPTTLPPNVEPIAPMAVPLEAVGVAVGDLLVVTATAADTCALDGAPQVAASDAWNLEVVTVDSLVAMLEARELVLRRRFENVF